MPTVQERKVRAADLRVDDLLVNPKGEKWKVTFVKPVSGNMHVVTTFGLKQWKGVLPFSYECTVETEVLDLDEVVAVVEQELGGVVLSDYSDQQEAAMAAASEASPVSVTAFEDMDILAMRYHLFRFHGIDAQDMKTRDVLIAAHREAEAAHAAGTLKSEHIPHTHR